MNWTKIWMDLFGTTQWMGLNMGFWVSMGVVALLVLAMNLVFWSFPPHGSAKKKIRVSMPVISVKRQF